MCTVARCEVLAPHREGPYHPNDEDLPDIIRILEIQVRAADMIGKGKLTAKAVEQKKQLERFYAVHAEEVK